MDSNEVPDSGKNLFDKIPDLAFDWYARLIPGLICFFLIEVVYHFDQDVMLKNSIFILLIAYIIGHITQPFSSGLLQRRFKNLRGKKGALLSKAYSELIGFFSCLLFSIAFLLFKLIDNMINEANMIQHQYYYILIAAIIIFWASVFSRKKAYDRKYKDQLEELETNKAGSGKRK